MRQWRPLVTLSPRDDLSPNDSLLDSDDATRYCSPCRFDLVKCEPEVSAFQQAEGNLGVSINRIHHYEFNDREQAVDMIRKEFRDDCHTLSEDGRFVLFNIKTTKHALSKVGFGSVSFIYTPTTKRPSHADIMGLPTDRGGSLLAAASIKRSVIRTFPGL